MIPDPLLGSFFRISLDDILKYQECQVKHAGAVNRYIDARAAAIKANEGRR